MDPYAHFWEVGLYSGFKAPRSFVLNIHQKAENGNKDSIDQIKLIQKYLAHTSLFEIFYDPKVSSENLGCHAPDPHGINVALGIVLFNNTVDEISKLLTSVYKSSFVENNSAKVYIINNGAPLTDDMQHLLERFSCEIIPNLDGNIGSSAGHSRLMKHVFENTMSLAYLTINPDGFFHPDALMRMVKMAMHFEWNSAIEAAQLPNENSKYYNINTYDTEWAVTACALFPKKIWQTVGGFDPNIFLYCDDVDYGWEIRRAGFFVKYCPWAYFYHDYASRTATSDFFRKNSLEAGRYLGHKWGNQTFLNSCETKLIAMGFYNSVDEMRSLDGLTVVQDPKGVPNFDNEFFFAKRRW